MTNAVTYFGYLIGRFRLGVQGGRSGLTFRQFFHTPLKYLK